MSTYSGKPMKDIQGFLEPAKIAEIIQHGETQRDRLLMKTLWATGARISEIVGKKICQKCGQPAHYDSGQKDPPRCQCSEPEYIHKYPLIRDRIQRKERALVLYTLKRGDEALKRLVKIPSNVTEELIQYSVGMKPEDRIFPITQERAYQIVRASAERAGIEKVGDRPPHPHVFRHSHAVAYIKGETSVEGLRKLQRRFKHSSIDMTAHYLQFATDEKEKEKIREVFGDV